MRGIEWSAATILLLLLFPPLSGHTQDGRDECAVYTALFAKAIGEREAPLWLTDRTLSWPNEPFWTENTIREFFPELPDEMVSDFLQKNAESGPLPCLPRLPQPVFVVTAAAVADFHEHAGHRPFFQVDPQVDAVWSVSRVGFNATGDQALVHDMAVCGSRCGGDALVHLVRRAGKWEVVVARTILQY
jgi:hypothetical protein